jgi:hypothetical protein
MLGFDEPPPIAGIAYHARLWRVLCMELPDTIASADRHAQEKVSFVVASAMAEEGFHR